MEFYLFFVLFAHSLQGLLAGPPVEVTPERIILLENRPLEVKCRVRQPITYCRFSLPGRADALSLRPTIPAHEGIQYLGAGLEHGECGMLIQSVKSQYSGVINCSMGLSTEITESKGNLTLIVARPPDPPILQVFPGSSYRDAFREGESIQANCRIVNARPVANISWYLGAEPIYDRLGPTVVEEENGFLSISQNMTRKVTYLDHGKDLKCVAGHIALGQGNINHSIYKLNIRFPPKPKSQELEKFGFTIGQPGKIVVTFQANPIPDIVWKVDQDNLKQGTRDRTGRFEAGILQHKGAGTWDAILLINTVRPEEVEKRYTLIAQNELGRESYKVAISTSPEPPADITAGTIVGIVIAVLVILLLVFILIFARATGRWCFAGGLPRQPGESITSCGWVLGRKSLRNPEKVNSLIYKDYTLLEYGDGTKAYVSPEDKARLLLERKLSSSKVSVKNEKANEAVPDSESESESGYEVPVERQKGRPRRPSDAAPPPEARRKSSFPFSGGETSPGDNGRINLPPYLVPLETSLTLPMSKEKRRQKKSKKKKKKKEADAEEGEKGRESSSLDEVDFRKRFSLKDPFWARSKRKSSDAFESPESAEVGRMAEDDEPKRLSVENESGREGEENAEARGQSADRQPETESGNAKETNRSDEPEDGEAVVETPENLSRLGNEGAKRYSRGFSLARLSSELSKPKGRRASKKIDPNPLRKMFGTRGSRQGGAEAPGRYEDADLSQIRSDTESADHGSADKSSVSKLTSEKQPKKLMSGLLGSFRRGRTKDRVADNDADRNPSSFEIAVKEQPEDADHPEATRTEGIVYAELDMARTPGSVMRRDDEKTEYAEIIYPGSKLAVEKPAEELRKSRENLTSSRENLTEVDEAFSTSADGKKEAAV